MTNSGSYASRGIVTKAIIASLAVSPADAFIEDILNQAFGGSGGGGIHFEMGGGGFGGIPMGALGGGRRGAPEETKFPSGIEDKIDKKFNWLKGTEWYWNRWDNVKFAKDGSFEARTQSCMTSGACKWSAYNHQGEDKIFIMWGKDGLHTMKIHGDFPTTQDADILQQIELIGHRAKDNREPSKKREAASAVFDKVYDHNAYKDSVDLYEVLGLHEKHAAGEEITPSEIKKVYRKASLKYHPDKNSDPAIIAMYQEMTAAYEVLSDPAKRARYDCCGMEGVKGEMPSGKDMSMQVSVTLEELYTGTKRIDNIRRRVICRVCRNDPGHPNCASCGRCPNETKMVQQQVGPGMIIQQQQEVKSKDKCKQESTPLRTEIERGMRDDDKITFPHMAEQTPGQLPGDVVLVLNMRKHNKFTRQGNHLHMNIKISLKEALLGFKRRITHLDGHTVDLVSESPTAPFQTFKIEKEGMPYKDDPTQFGHLFVKAEVLMPKHLSKQQQGLIEQAFPEKLYHQEL